MGLSFLPKHWSSSLWYALGTGNRGVLWTCCGTKGRPLSLCGSAVFLKRKLRGLGSCEDPAGWDF